MIFFNDKRIRTLILVMSVLAAIAFLIIRYYYRSVNESVDARVVPARQLYAQYNELAARNDFEAVFVLLDSIETIYGQYPHYRNSYEVGVLNNNRAAALLTMALYKDSMTIASPYFNMLSVDTLFTMAEIAVMHSINCYESWNERYANAEGAQLDSLLLANYYIGLEAYAEEDQQVFFETRKEEIEAAQYENARRLSVSYTNLGIIARNAEAYDQALQYYKKALDLWDRNLVAENNINILMGRPMTKRNVIQKLFPPEKED